MIKEIFKDIPNYEGLYQVSNLGNVKSIKFNEHRLLKFGLTSGYRRVNLYKNKTRQHCQVHVLVCIAFLNHKPNGHKIVVDHINNDKLDNRVENLQLVTNRENTTKESKGNSKYIGVWFEKSRNKYKASIYIDGKNMFLGRFTNEIDAHNAYQNKLLCL